jgi:hypothetical protein
MHKSTRLTRTIAIAAFVTIGVSACSIQGSRAEQWLSTDPIMESVDVRLTGCEGMCDPEVEGVISDSASEDDVRQLGESATDYLSEANRSGVEMNLTYGKVNFEIGATQDETSASVDMALSAFADDRVSAAYVNQRTATLWGPKTALSTLYRDYNAPKSPQLSLNADDARDNTGFSLDGGTPGCDDRDRLLTEFDSLVLDPTVTSLRLVLCERFDVTVTDLSAREPMIAALQTLASDPLHSSVAFSVLVEDELPYPVTFDTAERLEYLALVGATDGVHSVSVRDAVMTVDVDDANKFASVVTSISAVPKPGSLDAVRFTVGGISIFLDADHTIGPQLAMSESLLAMEPAGEEFFFRAETQRDGGFTLSPEEYDSEVGRQIVDVIIASGLSQSVDMQISVRDSPVQFQVTAPAGSSTFEIETSNDDRGNTELIEKLTTYWAEQLAR